MNKQELAEQYVTSAQFDLEYSSFGHSAKIAKEAIEWCLTELAKQSGEYQKAWHIKWKERIPSDSITFFEPDPNAKWEYTEKITKYIEYNALLAANAKNAKLEEELQSRIEIKADASERIYNELEKKHFNVVNENTELQQRVKELSHSTVLAANEVLKERVKELEAKLEKAEQVIAFYANKENWLCDSVTSSDVDEFQEAMFNHESKSGGKRARTYLSKQKGGV